MVTYAQYQELSVLKTKIGELNRELNLIRIHVRHLWKDAVARQRQIQELQNETLQMRRFRAALKTLLKSVNNAINQRIEAMNGSLVRGSSFSPEPNVLVEDADTPRTLLKKIQLFDYKNNYKRTIFTPPSHTLRYRMTKNIYNAVKKLVRLTIKGIKKVRRAI